MVIAKVASLLRRLDREAGVDDADDADESGGGGELRRGEPPAPSGGGEPAWWRQFEREFADYVAHAQLPSRA